MTVLYRCDECAAVAATADAVGWVELRPLGGRPLREPEPTHLCARCWARTSAEGHATRAAREGEPQLSEHTQNRDTVQ